MFNAFKSIGNKEARGYHDSKRRMLKTKAAYVVVGLRPLKQEKPECHAMAASSPQFAHTLRNPHKPPMYVLVVKNKWNVPGTIPTDPQTGPVTGDVDKIFNNHSSADFIYCLKLEVPQSAAEEMSTKSQQQI